ncbi:MAG: dynamin family protein [Actinomycetota bacterium]
MSDLEALVDLADLAVARSEGVIDPLSRDELAEIVRRTRRRLGFLGEVLVVAFAGGTGSGKSSVVNALVGEDVAEVGVLRPTTDNALAVIPQKSKETYGRLLSDLGVSEKVSVATLKASLLVDLPDFDSTQEAHRRIVEDVLPLVDAVVWVFDPEKYADQTIHADFLAGLVPYQEQFVFVLNQVDRLGDAHRIVADDLVRLLGVDGFDEPRVVSTCAAQPGVDVDELVSVLTGRLSLKRTAVQKLATDLRLAANRGWQESVAAIEAESGEERRYEVGFSAATFVSLGVQAFDVLYASQEDQA